MDQNNQIELVIKQSGLEVSKTENLMKSFAGYFSEAKKIVDECKNIQVTDESQKDLMQSARENRLKLKDIRVECEKTRVKLKEQSLREGKAIDGISNVIKALIIPIEEHLEKQEKFAEIKEQLRIEKQLAERMEKLSKYVNDISLYDLKSMADEVFNNLLSGCKTNWEKAQDDQRLAEEKRIADQKIEAEKQEKIRLDNEKLRIELAAKDKVLETERKAQEETLKKEREAREKIEKELNDKKIAQDKKEADEKAKLDAENKVKEDEERKRLLAPDKEKLLELANTLDNLLYPAVQSRNAQIVIEQTEVKIMEVVEYIREKSKTL